MSFWLRLLFPPRCLGCEQLLLAERSVWCAACSVSLEDNQQNGVEPAFPLTRAWAPYVHGGALAQAVHRFKYQQRSDLARPLGDLLAATSAAFVAPCDFVVPIPLHHQRFRERGFDQSTLLAAQLCANTGTPLRVEWLQRIRNTPRQVELDHSQRQHNVDGAFQAQHARGHLCLVDDVFTTGATARAAADALLHAGAETVRVLTLSTMPKHSMS
jgi:ComF family protein